MEDITREEYEENIRSANLGFQCFSKFVVAHDKVTLCKISIGDRPSGVYYAFRIKGTLVPPEFDGMKPVFKDNDYPIFFACVSQDNDYRWMCMTKDSLELRKYDYDNLSYNDYVNGVGDPENGVFYKMTPGPKNKYHLWDEKSDVVWKTTFEITGVSKITKSGDMDVSPVFPTPSSKMATIVFE